LLRKEGKNTICFFTAFLILIKFFPAQIDFTSSLKLLKVASNVLPSDVHKKKPRTSLCRIPALVDTAIVTDFFKNLENLSNGKAAVLTMQENYMEITKTKDLDISMSLNGSFLTYFDEKLLNTKYIECINNCIEFAKTLSMTEAEAAEIEELTRNQSGCQAWFDFRAGRVTGSKISLACKTSLAMPSISLIKSVCSPMTSKNKSRSCQYGMMEEANAILKYREFNKIDHTNFDVSSCGLFVSVNKPFIASSPDGLVKCDCCGPGVLEVKCPSSMENRPKADCVKLKYLVKNNQGHFSLKATHEYYYQVQNHLYCVENVKYCDFVVYTKIDLIVIRIFPNISFQQDMIAKSESFFLRCILPEIRAHSFSHQDEDTEKRIALAPLDTNTLRLECYCNGKIVGGESVTCSNSSCAIKTYHLQCLMLEKKDFPKKSNLWECHDCHRKKWHK
jgi:YqaJ-like viral recombinase domain